MKNTFLQSSCALLLAVGLPLGSYAEDIQLAKAPVEHAADTQKGAKVPYHGKVSAIDAAGKTFSIKGKERERVFTVTDSTKITRDGAVAEFSGIAAGEEVRGQAERNGEKWQAVSVMTGLKGAASAKEKEAKPSAKAEAKQ